MDSREEERWKKETKTDSRVEEARLGETCEVRYLMSAKEILH